MVSLAQLRVGGGVADPELGYWPQGYETKASADKRIESVQANAPAAPWWSDLTE
jgi:hypothetical protein